MRGLPKRGRSVPRSQHNMDFVGETSGSSGSDNQLPAGCYGFHSFHDCSVMRTSEAPRLQALALEKVRAHVLLLLILHADVRGLFCSYRVIHAEMSRSSSRTPS